MANIFISYRREDSQAIADRIHDRLVVAFKNEKVFKDVDDIPFGLDFRDVLRDAINGAQIILVIIGPNWATITDKNGRSRLGDPDDFVRIEVENALNREEARVVPVLVQNTKMPAPEQVPESIRPICYLNAIIIRNDPDFNNDIHRLVNNLKPLVKANSGHHRRTEVIFGLIAALAVLIILYIVGIINRPGGLSVPTKTSTLLETDVATDSILLSSPSKTSVAMSSSDTAPRRWIQTELIIDNACDNAIGEGYFEPLTLNFNDDGSTVSLALDSNKDQVYWGYQVPNNHYQGAYWENINHEVWLAVDLQFLSDKAYEAHVTKTTQGGKGCSISEIWYGQELSAILNTPFTVISGDWVHASTVQSHECGPAGITSQIPLTLVMSENNQEMTITYSPGGGTVKFYRIGVATYRSLYKTSATVDVTLTFTSSTTYTATESVRHESGCRVESVWEGHKV